MRIGIDTWGGDYAPEAIVEGALLAAKELKNKAIIVLIGDENKAKSILTAKGCTNFDMFEFVHTTEAIEMGEHPTKAFQKKPTSSIALGFGMLAKKQIQGFASIPNPRAILEVGFF